METPIAFCFPSEQIKNILKVSRKEHTIQFRLSKSPKLLELFLSGPCGSKIGLSLPIESESTFSTVNFSLRIQDLIQSLELIDQFEGSKEETGKILLEYNFSEFIKLKSEFTSNVECLIHLVNFDPLKIDASRKVISKIGGSSKYFRRIFSSCFNSLRSDHLAVIFGNRSISFIKSKDALGSIETKLCTDDLSQNKKLCLECKDNIRINIAEAILNIIQNFLKMYDEFFLEISEVGASFVLVKNSLNQESTLKICVH